METILFETTGPDNTENTLIGAFNRSNDLGILDIILATRTGATAKKALKIFDTYKYNIVAVTHVTGYKSPGKQEMSNQVRKELQIEGMNIISSGHPFGGIGRGIRNKLGTYQVDEIIAYTLRMFGQGIKVGVEISIMSADAGMIKTGCQVIAIGGTISGADSAMVLTPANSHNFLNTVIHEIIAKPRL